MPLVSPAPAVRNDAKTHLLTAIERKSAQCGVIGLGFIGSILMDALIEGGFPAHGFDRSQPAVQRFKNSTQAHRAASVSQTALEILDCDVIFIAIRIIIRDGVPDEEPLNAAVRLLSSQTRRPRLIILESTVSPGTTRRVAAQLGAVDDPETFIVHAPERLSAGHDLTVFRKVPHLVGGLDEHSTELGVEALAQLCDTVIPVSSPEVSELSKLLENGFVTVNIALINEVTRIAHSHNVNALDVCLAAATKPFGYMPFYPGPGVGGHCLPNDLALLSQSALRKGWTPELLTGAIQVNDRASEVTICRLDHLLSTHGLSLTGASILLVGVGFKPGSGDTAQSPAYGIARSLRRSGAEPVFIDAAVQDFAVDDIAVQSCSTEDLAARRFTAAVILSGDTRLSAAELLQSSDLVLDTMTRSQPATASPRWHVL